MVDERRLSTGAAARIAGCHPVTVLRAIERGELAAVRLGEHGHYRIAREDFQGWLRPTNEETRGRSHSDCAARSRPPIRRRSGRT